jgi:hypothetical protein
MPVDNTPIGHGSGNRLFPEQPPRCLSTITEDKRSLGSLKMSYVGINKIPLDEGVQQG